MTLHDAVLDVFLFVFFASGSWTLGYLFLRIGWPKIRVLEKSYKKGWSIVFGLSFAVATSAFAFFFSLFPYFGGSFREFFFLFLVLSFLIAFGTLTFMRKFFRKKKVTVVVPSSFVQAKVVAQKAKSRLETDPDIVIVSKPEETLKSMLIEKSKRVEQPVLVTEKAEKESGKKMPFQKKLFIEESFKSHYPEIEDAKALDKNLAKESGGENSAAKALTQKNPDLPGHSKDGGVFLDLKTMREREEKPQTISSELKKFKEKVEKELEENKD